MILQVFAAALHLAGIDQARASLPLAARTEREAELARISRALTLAAAEQIPPLDPLVLLAVCWHESRLNPATVNGKRGEVGMCQLRRMALPMRFRDVSDEALRNIEAQAFHAARYFATFCVRSGWTVRRSLTRWNGAGMKARRYASRVLATLATLERFRAVAS